MCSDPMYTWLVDELPFVLMASLSSMSVTATLYLADDSVGVVEECWGVGSFRTGI